LNEASDPEASLQAPTTTNLVESAHSRLIAKLKRLRGPIIAIAAGGAMLPFWR